MYKEYQYFIQYIKPSTYRRFKHFLVSNHILSVYHSRFLSDKGKALRDFHHNGHYCLNPYMLIENAFPIFMFPQETEYWQTMANKWRTYLNSMRSI